MAATWQASRSLAGWGAPLLCIATEPLEGNKHSVSSQQAHSHRSSAVLESTANSVSEQNLFCQQQGWCSLWHLGSRRKKGGLSNPGAKDNVLYLNTALNVLEGGKGYCTVWGTDPKASAISMAFFMGISETMEPSEKTTIPCSPEAFTMASNSCQHKAHPQSKPLLCHRWQLLSRFHGGKKNQGCRWLNAGMQGCECLQKWSPNQGLEWIWGEGEKIVKHLCSSKTSVSVQ